MEKAGINEFAFTNVIGHHVDRETFGAVDAIRVIDTCRKHQKIVSLGGFADKVLTRLGVDHYPLPHPSPRNRQWNDREFEKKVLY